MSYFWSFGRCSHCDWPHHVRVDRRYKPKRWWRRKAAPAASWVVCCNCGHSTEIDAGAAKEDR